MLLAQRELLQHKAEVTMTAFYVDVATDHNKCKNTSVCFQLDIISSLQIGKHKF